jgi:hypothetical protein
MGTRNPNVEIRNNIEIPRRNEPNADVWDLEFVIWSLFRISIFDIRISDAHS